jgi:signal transduction histidine kinase
MKSPSLRTKFILAFLLASLVAIGLVGISTSQISSRQFQSFVIKNLIENYSAIVQDYYESNQTLLGIQTALRYASGDYLRQYEYLGRPGIVLVLPNRIIIMGDNNHPSGTSLSRQEISDAHPIEVDGRTIAYLAVITPAFEPNPQEIQFIRQTNRALIFASLIAVILAILLGLLFTKTLLKPLASLHKAMRKIEKGDLSQRVPVTDNDELGDVISGFNNMSNALAKATAQRNQMTADIAHELRSPLTVINGYLEALQDGSLEPTSERLEIIQQEVNQLNRLVNDLRTLSLADAGQLSINKAIIDVATLFQHLEDAFDLVAKSQNIELHFHKTEDLKTIFADEGRILQVLSNLLTNAIRHTDAGGKVIVEAHQKNVSTIIKVSDTGEGIPDDQLAQIFQRFYRADPSRQSMSGETGLGLSIVKTLIEAHNGKVDVQSQIGHGTTFTIELPNQ